MIELVTGFFTTDNFLDGLTPLQMRLALGLPVPFLADGACIWQLLRQPTLTEFVDRGSTIRAGGTHMVLGRERETRCLPGEWHGRRLVKVKDVMRRDHRGDWPDAPAPRARQWQLTTMLPARLLCTLQPDQAYWAKGTGAPPHG